MSQKNLLRFFSASVFLFALSIVVAATGWAAEVKMTFYGNQHFRFVSTTGKVILINPWIKGNKDATGISVDYYKRTGVDLILPTSGHGDDQGNSSEIAAKTGATIFVLGELGAIMKGAVKKFGGNPKQVYSAAISGRYKLGGVTVQMLHAIHGSGVRPPKGHPGPLYGGFGTGFLITFENGLKVLMAGSTGLTLDLKLFGMRFQPHIAMIPIMGRYMMHPDDAAYAAKLLMTDNPNLKTVIPQHFRVKGAFPGMGTPAQFRAEVEKLGLPLRVLVPQVGKEIVLRK